MPNERQNTPVTFTTFTFTEEDATQQIQAVRYELKKQAHSTEYQRPSGGGTAWDTGYTLTSLSSGFGYTDSPTDLPPVNQVTVWVQYMGSSSWTELHAFGVSEPYAFDNVTVVGQESGGAMSFAFQPSCTAD